jgi:hypothetical protein
MFSFQCWILAPNFGIVTTTYPEPILRLSNSQLQQNLDITYAPMYVSQPNLTYATMYHLNDLGNT